MTKQFGIKIVVNKKRKIYFIENIKFHFDIVENLGTFIEVEAIDNNEKFDIKKLKNQCDKFFNFFELEQNQIIKDSYSDLILNLKNSR